MSIVLPIAMVAIATLVIAVAVLGWAYAIVVIWGREDGR